MARDNIFVSLSWIEMQFKCSPPPNDGYCWWAPRTCSGKEGLAAMFKRENHMKVAVGDHVTAAQMAEREAPLHPHWLSGPAHLRGEELLLRHKPAGLPVPHSGTTGTWTGACPRSRDAKKWTVGPLPNRPGTCDVQRQSSNHFRGSRCWAASRSKPSIRTECSLTDWERWKSIFQSWIGLPRTQISTLLKQRRIISTENGQKEAKIQTTTLNILQDVWKTIPQDILNKVVKAA